MNLVTCKEAGELFGLSETTIRLYTSGNGKWSCCKVRANVVDIDKINDIIEEEIRRNNIISNYGLMLWYYLVEVVGITKTYIINSIDARKDTVDLGKQSVDFYIDLISKYSYVTDDFKKSEYNYNNVLEEYETL
jgi:hypothetical protein